MEYGIIGFGCAGYHAARAIRKLDSYGTITVFEAGTMSPVNPMLTTYFASDKISLASICPFGSIEKICQELNIDCRLNESVHQVNAAQKSILLGSGEEVFFDKLLISTGAKAILPQLDGLPDPRVFLMRTVADAERLRSYINTGTAKHAVVVGASMVGIKVAELLWQSGIHVTMADAAEHLFPLAAFEPVAREMERRLRANGFQFKWGTCAQKILPEGLQFADGAILPADIICFCVGTRANIDLVANTDIVSNQSITIKRGIVVNERMSTSCPDIYAAGDCCEGTDLQSGETMPIGLWANAGAQGETAGTNMAGGTSHYPGNIVHNITHFMNMDFISLGNRQLPGETICCGNLSSGLYIQAVVANRHLLCANILDGPRVSGVLKSILIKQIVHREASLSLAQRAILAGEGVSAEFLGKIGG